MEQGLGGFRLYSGYTNAQNSLGKVRNWKVVLSEKHNK